MGVDSGDLRVQGWNFNILTKEFKTWRQFINKLKNSNVDCFIPIDSRFETSWAQARNGSILVGLVYEGLKMMP